MQSKTMSLVESTVNTVVGLTIAWLLAMWVFPKFGYPITAGHALSINLIFYVASTIRSYFLRRLFNR